MVPETGAATSMYGDSVEGSPPNKRIRSSAVCTSTLALVASSSADCTSFSAMAPRGEQQPGPLQLPPRQQFVGLGFAEIGDGQCQVGAGEPEQELALLHVVAQPRGDFHDAASGERVHRLPSG